MRSLKLKNFLGLKTRAATAPEKGEPSSAPQGRLISEGHVRVKGNSLCNTWKQVWVELRESSKWKPVLEFYVENAAIGYKELVDTIEVGHVRRVMSKKCTLRVESIHNQRKFYLQFSREIELYDWLDEIYSRCPGTGVVDYETLTHDAHIRGPDEGGNIRGFPRVFAEYVDMYSVRSSLASTSSGQSPPPDQSQSQAGLSSVGTESVITPKSTLPGANVDIVSSEEENYIDIPRVDLPDDHIGFAPGIPSSPDVSPHRTARLLQERVVGIIGQTVKVPKPHSPVLDLQRPQEHCGRSSVVHVRDLTRIIRNFSRYPVATGGFSDVYQAQLVDGGITTLVGVKHLREPISSPAFSRKLAKRLKSEINVWHCLDHPNVVKLLGICRNLGRRPALVSAWYENGHVMTYLENLRSRATLGLKLKLILDIAEGLSYLHSFTTPVLHCDLKAANVLVSCDGVACLSDFGLSSLFENLTSSKCLSDSGALNGSVRWMAIELVCSLGEENGFIRFTPATDIYSFGSTMLEILSGKIPYHNRRLDAQVIMDIYRGVRHRREESGVPLMYWQLMERCWADIPEERPYIGTILRELACHYRHQQFREANGYGLQEQEQMQLANPRRVLDAF